MSDPTKEEMLGALKIWREFYLWHHSPLEDAHIYNAIYNLIEHRPRVTREELESLAQDLKFVVDYTIENGLDYPMDLAIINATNFIKNLGVEVSDE
jgi:hypothetical protein